MKVPLDQRGYVSDRLFTRSWDCTYWSRDDQVLAAVEGWCLQVFAGGDNKMQDRILLWRPPQLMAENWCEFANHDEAIAHVAKRAEEGSPLHCRALVLHVSSVLKYGR